MQRWVITSQRPHHDSLADYRACIAFELRESDRENHDDDL